MTSASHSELSTSDMSSSFVVASYADNMKSDIPSNPTVIAPMATRMEKAAAVLPAPQAYRRS